jgi:[acyl-carrier-protein] S-malonyltransferase
LFAYLFPGQGSQAVGMGADLAERFASAREVFQTADHVLGFKLSTLCFEGPEPELRSTLNTQPAVYTVSWACLQAAWEAGALERNAPPAFVAGHSLGEYTAVVAAGSLPFEDGLRLVRERARLMEEACRQESGTMAAVMGMERSRLEEVCAEAGVEIANLNAPDQIAISGDVAGIERAMELAKERGARRVIPLPVGGAFHSRLMAPANEGMAKALEGVTFRDPSIPIVANTTGAPLTTAAAVHDELRKQLCAPVLWEDTVTCMSAAGVTGFIEIGPGKVLSGLVKRIAPASQTRALGDAASMGPTG